MDRLDTFLAATDSDDPHHVALRALTLHMLRGLAPRAFERRGLAGVQQAALEKCAAVPLGLAEPLDAEALQTGIDAWFCRHVKGLPHPPPAREALRAALDALVEGDLLIYAWLLGEIAARCGVDARVKLPKARPYVGTSRLHDTYWLTHLVMLDTDYFARHVTHREANDWADALESAARWLQRQPNDDLAGEVALCLRVLGRDASLAFSLFQDHAPPEDPHAQATALLALSVE